MAGRIALEAFDGRAARPDQGDSEPEPSASVPPEPQPPAADPAAERNATLAHIATSLDRIAAEQASLRAAGLRQAADALAAAASEMLPVVAQAGFAALVAETAMSVARNGQWPELVLSLSPDDVAEVATHLSAAQGGAGFRIATRNDLAPGEAEIAWEGGGAEIDAAAIAATALERLRRELDRLKQAGE